jgi:histidinol dehydrogenase
MITGPGNRFVAAAKRLVKGVVGIDSEAGPSEIGIIADETAHPEFIAADLISQAEHDENASAVLLTHSMELAERVAAALARRVPMVANRERVEQALGGEQSALIVMDSLEHTVMLSNAIAPEHLEVMLEDPEKTLPLLVHAGAIFVGDYTPVSAGDYSAGSNHVLPTHGTAVFSSGLSPMTFLRTQQIIEYDKDALSHIAGHVETFARAEDLPAHAEAITERFLERPGTPASD